MGGPADGIIELRAGERNHKYQLVSLKPALGYAQTDNCINEEFPHYLEQRAFDEALEQLPWLDT